jgi:mRNA-degrading endonuclease toxin of MazEF toxin-antitoxin module
VDIFDPNSYDANHELAPLAALIREGVITVEHLRDADSFMALSEAIGQLDEDTMKVALLMAVIQSKRAHGMTDAEYQAWALKDAPRRDDRHES